MKKSVFRCFVPLLLLVTTFPALGTNWPGWRGPSGSGASPDRNFPIKWSANENLRWRFELSGRGNSSAVVWADRVFVTQATSSDDRRTLVCLDRSAGTMLWQAGVTYREDEPTHRENPYAAATPVTDGERVIVAFGSAGLFCYDFAGKEIWRRDFGKMNHMFGNASSPVLAGELCVLPFGPDEKARLIAVNKRTGETAWEAEPPKVDPSEQQMRGGFGGGPGGGGLGGRGGFGPGMMLAPQIVAQADKDGDRKLTAEEFTNLAGAWFDKLDPEKTGRLAQQAFTDRFGEVLSPPQGADNSNRGGERGGGRRGGGGAGRLFAPGLFTAADADKDGSLTGEELNGTFTKWFSEWDRSNSKALDEDQLAAGLTAALPRPQFDGPGGGGGRSGGRGGFGGGGPGGTWSSPIVIKVGDHEELIMCFPNRVVAYDPPTGKQLWISKGVGGTIYTTPVWGEGILFATTSGPGGGAALAVKPGGSGDVSETQRLWRVERFKSGIGSGVIHEGHLYSISQEGIAVCVDLKAGDTVWEERLKGSGSRGSSWSSMLLADGKIYVPNQSGDVFVLRAAPKFELLATNALNEPTNSSLAASDGELFLRTDKAIWCFANSK